MLGLLECTAISWVLRDSLLLPFPGIAPTSPGQGLTLGWSRLSKLLLCPVRVAGVTLIYSVSPGPEMSLIKATHDLHATSTGGHISVFMLLDFSESGTFNTVGSFLHLEVLAPPGSGQHNGLFLSYFIGHFVWSLG